MSPDHHALEAMLTRLHLIAIRDQLDSLLDEAAKRELTLREAVGFLCEREVSRRDERRVEMATKIAHFPTLRDLDSFDFVAQPSIDKAQIRDLAVCRWVAHGEALLLLGPPGVGKTHLAIALGRTAIRGGYSGCSPLRPPSSPRWPARMPTDGWRSGSASTPSPSC
jgi:DNA replication protein DnaC